MVSDEPASLNDVAQRLDELIAWQRFESIPKLRTLLLKELDSDIKKLAYEMTDGGNSRRDIASALKISDDNIQHYWEKWYELAIVRPSKRKGRPQHVVSLEDLGIKVSKIVSSKIKEGEEKTSEQQTESVSESSGNETKII